MLTFEIRYNHCMEQRTELEQQLKEIADILSQKYTDSQNVGVIAGISGMALFQFYYSKYLNVDTYSEIGVDMIAHCVEKINNGYSFPTYCNGIAGLGWAIQHLKNEEFIDIDCDELLSPFDDYLYQQMMFHLRSGDYDFLHGGMGYAFYFFSRYRASEGSGPKERYKSYILDFIEQLNNLAITAGNTLKWESTVDFEKGTKAYNLSLSHGISSILSFLSRLHRFRDFEAATANLIRGASNYMLSNETKDPTNLSLYPSWVEKGTVAEYNSRLAWCYGDLGIGISLMEAGVSLEDSRLQQQAHQILEHTMQRKTTEETSVTDAGICHGSYGNAQIYRSLSKQAEKSSFEHVSDFWIADGIQKAIHKDGYAGYKKWNPLENRWETELSLLEGIAGIGLAIIDKLSDEPNSWDECLMIG